MYAWELIAARLLKEADGGMGSFFMIQKFHVKILGICADRHFSVLFALSSAAVSMGAMYYGSSDAG